MTGLFLSGRYVQVTSIYGMAVRFHCTIHALVYELISLNNEI